MDLSSLASVKKGAEGFLSKHSRLDILVLNAGVMAIPNTASRDGYEMQFATNHLGHFLLTNLLTTALQKAAPSRVVVVSSIAHHFPFLTQIYASIDYSRVQGSSLYQSLLISPTPNSDLTLILTLLLCNIDFRFDSALHYDATMAYGRSKLANVLFSHELSRSLMIPYASKPRIAHLSSCRLPDVYDLLESVSTVAIPVLWLRISTRVCSHKGGDTVSVLRIYSAMASLCISRT